MNVVEILHARALAHPHRDALVDASTDRTLTYAELDASSERAAAAMRAHGLRAGDTALLLHPVGLEFYAALIGLLRAGLVPAIPPPGMTRAALRRCARVHAPHAVLVGGIGWLTLAAVPALRHAVRLSTTPSPLAHDVLHDAPAMPTFTSGSTDTPNALARTHGAARAQIDALARALELDGATSPCTMPAALLAELAAGATCLLPGTDASSARCRTYPGLRAVL
jgi:acyl-CoA synthetase (AMP-forming)/AMP-acid ligase II